MSRVVLDTDGTYIDVAGSLRRPRMDRRLITPPHFMTFEDVRVALGSSVVWMAATPSETWSAATRDEEEEQISHDDDDGEGDGDDIVTGAPRLHRASRSSDTPDLPDVDEGEDSDGSGKGGYADIGGWIESTYELDDSDIVEMWDDPEPSGMY